MRRLSACGLAPAVCGGGSDSVSGRTPTVGEIRALTGPAAPVETAEAAQERSLDIFARSDSLVLSTTHGETGNAEVPAFRLLTRYGGARCTVAGPPSGAVDAIEPVNTPLGRGAATAIGSKHGLALVSESSTHTRAE